MHLYCLPELASFWPIPLSAFQKTAKTKCGARVKAAAATGDYRATDCAACILAVQDDAVIEHAARQCSRRPNAPDWLEHILEKHEHGS